MPKGSDKVYLTLCSCGPANLSKFTRPSVELLGASQVLRFVCQLSEQTEF
jgi:hypothetical protein